ncbi:MAG: hypothetical protein ACRD63_09475 [Pyrinomonadaceae bacterium]
MAKVASDRTSMPSSAHIQGARRIAYIVQYTRLKALDILRMLPQKNACIQLDRKRTRRWQTPLTQLSTGVVSGAS